MFAQGVLRWWGLHPTGGMGSSPSGPFVAPERAAGAPRRAVPDCPGVVSSPTVGVVSISREGGSMSASRSVISAAAPASRPGGRLSVDEEGPGALPEAVGPCAWGGATTGGSE